MTTTITTRVGKGGRLSFTEMDANFTNLKATADASAVQATTYLKSEVDSALATKQPLIGFTPVNAATAVTSVAGRTGAVVLTQADVSGLTTSSSPSFMAVTASAFNGNASSATKLQTAQSINLMGDVSGTIMFDGSVSGSWNVNLTTSGVTAGTYSKVTVDAKGRVTAGAALVSSDVTTALGFTPQDIAVKDVANGYPGLDASGKISTSALPAIAITDTFVVASQTAMLALTAQTGDVTVRTDLNKTFILKGSSSSTLADWQELLTPTDLVQSVNGMTGAVTLTSSNVNEGSNLYFTTARASSAAPVQTVAGRVGAVLLAVADISGAAPLASPVFTGTVSGTFSGNGAALTSLTGANVTGTVPLATSAVTISGTYAGSLTSSQVTTAFGFMPASSGSNTALSLVNGAFGSATLTTSATTANQVVDSIAITAARSVKYLIQITAGTSYHAMEMLIIHDGTTAYASQSNDVFTSSILASFDSTIVGGNLQLLVTPVNAVSTIKVIRTSVAV